MKIYVFGFLLLLNFSVQAQHFSQEDFSVFNRYCIDFRTGNLPNEVNGKWGFVDENDLQAIAPIYDSVLYAGLGLCLAKNKSKVDVINQDLEVLRTFKSGEVFFDTECFSIRYKKNGQDRYLDYVNYVLLDSTLSQSWYTRRNTTKFKLYDFIPNRDFDPTIIQSISYDELVRKKLYRFKFDYVDGTNTVFDSVRYFSLKNAPYFLHGENGLEVYDLKNKEPFGYKDFEYQDICKYEGKLYFLFKKSQRCVVLDEERNVHLIFNSPSKKVSFERSSGYVYAGSKLNPKKMIFFPTIKEVKGEFAMINGSTRNFLRAETEDSIFYYHKGARFIAFKTDRTGETNYSIAFDETDHLLKLKQDDTYLLYSSSGKLLLSSENSFDINGELIKQRGEGFSTNYYLYSACLDELIPYEKNKIVTFGAEQFLSTKDETIVDECGKKLINEHLDYMGVTRSKSGNRILTLNSSEDRAYLHSNLKFLTIDEDVRFREMMSVDRNPRYVRRNNKYLGRHFEITDENNELVGAVDQNGNVLRFWNKTFVRYNPFGQYYFVVGPLGDYKYIRF